MRLATILVYVFFISTTGQTAQTSISDDIIYNGINRLYGWNNPEILKNDCRSTQQTAIDSYLVTETGYLFGDCAFNTQPKTILFAYDPGGMNRVDYFNDGLTQLASAGYHSIYASTEISTLDSGKDGELADYPNSSHSYYDETISWVKDVYHGWADKDRYGSIRLLLLSFGLVGLIGIRRKFKKNLSAKISERSTLYLDQ